MNIKYFIKKAGGVQKLADTLDMTRAAIYKMMLRQEELPPLYVDALRYRHPEWFTETSPPK